MLSREGALAGLGIELGKTWKSLLTHMEKVGDRGLNVLKFKSNKIDWI